MRCESVLKVVALSMLVGASSAGFVGAAAIAAENDAGRNQSIAVPSGANGPIPFIVVDQFGYPTTSRKIAIIRNPRVGYDKDASFTPSSTYQLVDATTGKVIKSGTPVAWNNGATDVISGDQVWFFDFSDVTAPGSYQVVDVEKQVRSPTFRIDDHVYRALLRDAVRMFFYQRAGIAKTQKTAGAGWVDAADHLGPGQDPYSHAWLAKNDDSQIKDLRGGWFDAGDYNKYTSWAARNIIFLLRAYEEHPAVFSDDFDIPESGNGIPDILDEAKWGLDWVARMQNEDGSLLCVQTLSEASPPSAAKGPSFYGPPTTSATLMGAAVFAYASKVFSGVQRPEMQAYAATLKTRAIKAWEWATANSDVLYYNNDDSKQPGSRGLASGQQEMTDAQRRDARFEAAAYLFEITHDPQYNDFAEKTFNSLLPEWGPTQWDLSAQEALIYYARLPGIKSEVKSQIFNKFVAGMSRNENQMPMILGRKDPYGAPIKDYTWGSNYSKAAEARLYELFASTVVDTATSATARSAALDYMHYIAGVNPLGLVYLSNMQSAGAEHSVTSMYHAWFSYTSARWSRVTPESPGPAPGYLVGGPNPAYEPDPCCTAPIGSSGYRCFMSSAYKFCDRNFAPPTHQPPTKAYLQFNDPWPAKSWEITEPSTGYQAVYILALAPFVN